MATKKTKSKKTLVKVDRPTEKVQSSKDQSFFERIQGDLEKNNSFINIVLGTLIVIVLGVLLFNYFNKPGSDLGPSGQAENLEETTQSADVTKESLPGQYTVKEGDTLFTIAQKYFDDGYMYEKIVEVNALSDGNMIAVGQVIDIPKLEDGQVAAVSTTPEPSSSPEVVAEASPEPSVNPASPVEGGQGGAENQTAWGEKITGNTYTVQEGDWLSKIAGRAYGNIYEYEKLAKTNNIANPDTIEVGTVIQIPR